MVHKQAKKIDKELSAFYRKTTRIKSRLPRCLICGGRHSLTTHK